MTDIEDFRGKYQFLSNFYPVNVTYGGECYPTVEHAYQAAKFQDISLRKKIKLCRTPGAAKRQAWLWAIETADWDRHRLDVMRQLVKKKFTGPEPQHEDLAQALLETGDACLVEGNTWKDTFWGVCKGEGENHLGLILMETREALGGYGVVEYLGDL